MKPYLFILFSLIANTAYCEMTGEDHQADCKKIKNFAVSGDGYYKKKQYSKAREQYEQQVAWSETCDFTKQQLAVAYNNVALTYLHQNQILKARAWLMLAPKDKNSIFNLNKINQQIPEAIRKVSNTAEGTYWQYVGKSVWNSITIKKEDAKYRFDFRGYDATPMMMYYGPNIGDFSTKLDIKNGRTHYAMSKDDPLLDCEYDFLISADKLNAKQTVGNLCGFGHNVYVDGLYYKVGL